MAGTKAGGKRAAQTNKTKYGRDFYAAIGAKGGSRKSQSKGFAYNTVCNCDLVAGQHFNKNCAGVKGGTASRRNKETK